jgi:transcription initiation factor TFIIB
MESVVASCIYAACRTYNIPRTLDEISAASEVERKEIGRTYRFIMRKLSIKINPSNPKDYISRFASILHLSPKTQNDALKILKKAESSELTSGRGPAGIAAAALYVAALLNEEKKTQREVADVAGITEVTIRNRYKELLEKLDIEDKLKVKEAESKADKDKKKKGKLKRKAKKKR